MNLPLIILDRDGTINQDRMDYIKSPEEWEALPGALEALAQLYKNGWTLTIATNQSGLARNLFDMDVLNAIHHKLITQLAEYGGKIDAIFFCPHLPEDRCHCRKPQNGMLQEICARFRADPHQTHLVGDSLTDLQAGESLGCRLHLVHTGLKVPQTPLVFSNLQEHHHLTDFANYLLNHPCESY
ncbi:MAG: D-glycero-beta-D-manno-heptose 1,7-bisphosphate 7-phosphatase [Gammaproteobacteria bacterium]|nr:D-glycero-beta-D-manno-heptose 1,7-bisphosphate 7-phosphatase [Gammaproteobacteria bacterium]